MTLLATLLLTAGCASLEWHKTGATGEYNAEQDQAQCTAQARLEAWQRMPMQSAPVPQIIIDQQGRGIPVNPGATQPDSERFFLEQSLLRQCMTDRGYTLQPRQPRTK